MNILTIQWSLAEISLALGITISIIGLLKPLCNFIKKKIQKANNRAEAIDQLPVQLNQMSEDIQSIKEQNKQQNSDIKNLNKKVIGLDNKITDLERQEIVREVNNTFYTFPDLESIPDDILSDTLASCEIYLNNNYNHNTKPKCEMLMEEYHRRLAKEAKYE